MTHLHFTLKTSEIQNLIDQSIKDDISKTILTTVFNQLMEEHRTQYIQVNEYERSVNRISQRNGNYVRSWTTRMGTLELKVREHVMESFLSLYLNVIKKTKKHYSLLC